MVASLRFSCSSYGNGVFNHFVFQFRQRDHMNFTWIFRNFSKAIHSPCISEVFKVDNFAWIIAIHVAKNERTGSNNLSLDLLFLGSKILHSNGKVYACEWWTKGTVWTSLVTIVTTLFCNSTSQWMASKMFTLV
ncbi:PREDICTED: uncharacterized protein LOC104810409 [Tarenaya hassleriana]|uniref:uncharacterized protein LOC104810409 n=1 Tax=Tarenaya hassleriana TaxID=28532 RepID=UPI00053C7CA7|nr:PREDICTED: uncharacterized protein LOC104810409 [Tarenaya hassleriana]